MQLETKRKLTYSDYEKLPEGAPYQLIDGELVMSPSPTPFHQIVSWRLVVHFSQLVLESNLGIVLDAPIDVYFFETEVYQPDIIFISRERLYIVEENRINGAPDIVIEIVSPASAYYDLKHKKNVYQRAGVKEYWIVDPKDSSIEVYENIGSEFKLFESAIGSGKVHSKVIQGLEIDVEKIFKPI